MNNVAIDSLSFVTFNFFLFIRHRVQRLILGAAIDLGSQDKKAARAKRLGGGNVS